MTVEKVIAGLMVWLFLAILSAIIWGRFCDAADKLDQYRRESELEGLSGAGGGADFIDHVEGN